MFSEKITRIRKHIIATKCYKLLR